MQQIIEIDPNQCVRWQYSDRSDFEFGNIYELAKDIEENGQHIPILVRHSKTKKDQYEIIAGARRWKACREINKPLKAIVRDVNDEQAAIMQIKENERMDICDYSKGMYYARLLEDRKLTQTALAKTLHISTSKFRNYLSFSKVPKQIWDAVDNIIRVSSRASTTIYELSQKSDEHIQALIDVAEEIRKGAGSRRIENLVHEILDRDSPQTKDRSKDLNTLALKSGETIAIWKDANLKFTGKAPFDRKKLNQHIMNFFENK